MALLKLKDENKYYNKDLCNLFENITVRGALFTDAVSDFKLDKQSNIKIYKFGEKFKFNVGNHFIN